MPMPRKKGGPHTLSRKSVARIGDVRRLIAAGMTDRAIARRLGVSRGVVSVIRGGRFQTARARRTVTCPSCGFVVDVER